jgi:transposase
MALSQSDSIIESRINLYLPHLNEYQSRHYLGAEAESLGWGGKIKISELTGVCRATISIGVKEVKEWKQQETSTRIRKHGGGQKRKTEKNPELLTSINEIISPHTMGDPGNPLIWSSKSVRKVQKSLLEQGYQISHETVRTCMKSLGYSLQSSKKAKEGGDHPDRDAQFEHINAQSKEFLSAGDPVISEKKKKKGRCSTMYDKIQASHISPIDIKESKVKCFEMV